MSGQRTPALGGPWLPAAWMQDSSAGGGVFLPCKFSNSLVSASPRMPWAPCSACQGHSRFPAVNAAFPGWQMFLCLCLSTHCLSVLFPIVIRLGCCSNRVSVVFPWSQQQEAVLSLAVTPRSFMCCAGHWENSVLVPIPAPVSEQAQLCSSPWCPGGTATAPCATVAASCPGAPCSPPAPGLSGNVAGGEGPRRAQQRVQQSLPWAAAGTALFP